MNTTWYLHSHFGWLRLSISSIANSLSCALAAHVWESPRWTAVSVKLLLPPRPSRPGELHPEPLTDPDMTLSRHPARAARERLSPFILVGGFLPLPVDPTWIGPPTPFAPALLQGLHRYCEVGRP